LQSNTDKPRKIWFWATKTGSSGEKSLQDKLNLLPARQQGIYHRLNSSKRRNEYLHSRLLICSALSSLQPRIPDNSWRIDEQPGRAPVIHGLEFPLYLSLSHSHELICLTLSTLQTGVDVELMKPDRDFTEAAKLFMTDSELRQQPTTPKTRAQYFYRLWCAKEAQYKALPRAEQEKTSLSKIDFEDLQASRNGWQLLELNEPLYQISIVHERLPTPVQLVSNRLNLD